MRSLTLRSPLPARFPTIVTDVLPVVAPLLMAILPIVCPSSFENNVDIVDVFHATVATEALPARTPAPLRAVSDVLDRQTVAVANDAPKRVAAVRANSPRFDPTRVTLVEPVDAAFVATMLLSASMSCVTAWLSDLHVRSTLTVTPRVVHAPTPVFTVRLLSDVHAVTRPAVPPIDASPLCA